MTARARLRWPRAGRALVVASIRRSPARRAADRRLRAREGRRIESMTRALERQPMTDEQWREAVQRVLGGAFADALWGEP